MDTSSWVFYLITCVFPIAPSLGFFNIYKKYKGQENALEIYKEKSTRPRGGLKMLGTIMLMPLLLVALDPNTDINDSSLTDSQIVRDICTIIWPLGGLLTLFSYTLFFNKIEKEQGIQHSKSSFAKKVWHITSDFWIITITFAIGFLIMKK